MRTPDRDRCRFAIAALCFALIILLIAGTPAAALSADYQIFPNGTAYRAVVEITDTTRYEFSEIGFMGENVPITIGEIHLEKNGTPTAFNQSRPWGQPSSITFEKGNYTITFTAPLKDNHLQGIYEKPYHINVTLPSEFDVRNPLLAGLSTGANVTRHSDNTTLIQWNQSYSFDLRFYDTPREEILYFFLQFMGILLIVLVVIPYLLSMKKTE
jgi:hypothetical protein